MALRGPDAHLSCRTTPGGWRRSGDHQESNWARLRSQEEEDDVEVRPYVSRSLRGPRPHSAIERGQRGGSGSWARQVENQNLQGGCSYFGDPAVLYSDRVPLHFSELTTSMPALNDKEPAATATTRQGLYSSHNRDFDSSSGSCWSELSQWESSLGSQESLQASAAAAAAAERRGSWERARIMQAPGKEEHTRLSNLTSVKIGWLPIKRRVVVTTEGPGHGSRHMDHSASQVKLKQPIAPTLQRPPVSSSANGCRQLGGEVERSHSGPSVVQGSRTWQQQQQQAPCFASPAREQVPEKSTSTRSDGDRLLGWQALKRGWAFNRASPPWARSQPSDLLTRNGSDTNGKNLPVDLTTGTESFQPHALSLNATDGVGQYKSHPPLRRSGAVQPVRPTLPLNRASSHVETSSALTTLIPQIKTGFSSITISSRKVTRSSSLPISGSSDRAGASPLLPLDGPNPNLVTMERKATIVKVTEHSMTSSGPPPRSSADEAERRLCDESDRAGHRTPDTVVRRRKATIIKVTEHSETSYRPADGHQDYRHSYTEGLYRRDSVWRQRDHLGTSEQDSSTPSGRPLGSPEMTSWTCDHETPDASTFVALSDPESYGHALHRSTLNLFVQSGLEAAEAPPPPTELSHAAAGGERWDSRPHRPLSCYARVCRHAEPSREEEEEENVARPAIMSRRLSFGLESNIDSGSPAGGGFASRQGTSQQGTHHEPRGDGSVRGAGPPVLQTTPRNTSKRPSPALAPPLTLIKSPDPDKQQTPEDILAANAAAIIANIKLQRRLNPVTSSSSSSSPQGNPAGCARNGGKPRSTHCRPDEERRSAVHLNPAPHAGFVPLSPGPDGGPGSATAVSLQEALEKSRPDFISRSQGRVRELEQKTQARRRRRRKRRGEQEAFISLDHEPPRSSDATLGHDPPPRCHPDHAAPHTDNLLRGRDRAITGKETGLRSQRSHNSLPEVKRKREAEKKRELYLTNRQRVELFKKKLLDQILQRTND